MTRKSSQKYHFECMLKSAHEKLVQLKCTVSKQEITYEGDSVDITNLPRGPFNTSIAYIDR